VCDLSLYRDPSTARPDAPKLGAKKESGRSGRDDSFRGGSTLGGTAARKGRGTPVRPPAGKRDDRDEEAYTETAESAEFAEKRDTRAQLGLNHESVGL
jgi:hypothetical protein